MKTTRRAAAKAAPKKTAPKRRKAAPRRLILKGAPPEKLTAEEVGHLEALAKRFADSEKAWQRMTAPVDDDPWARVEEHLLEKRADDSDRRWKFFAK